MNEASNLAHLLQDLLTINCPFYFLSVKEKKCLRCLPDDMEAKTDPLDTVDPVAKVLAPCRRAIAATASVLTCRRDGNGLSTDSLCAGGSLT